MPSRWNVSSISAAAGVGLASAAVGWLAFWPRSYVGTSASAVELAPGSQTSGASAGSVTASKLQGSLIDVNGLGVLAVLLVPVALTGLALYLSLAAGPVRWRRPALWGVAVALLGLCVLAAFSVGAFYLPAAVTTLVAAASYRSAERSHAAQ